MQHEKLFATQSLSTILFRDVQLRTQSFHHCLREALSLCIYVCLLGLCKDNFGAKLRNTLYYNQSVHERQMGHGKYIPLMCKPPIYKTLICYFRLHVLWLAIFIGAYHNGAISNFASNRS